MEIMHPEEANNRKRYSDYFEKYNLQLAAQV